MIRGMEMFKQVKEGRAQREARRQPASVACFDAARHALDLLLYGDHS
jgi:hypothetical protein